MTLQTRAGAPTQERHAIPGTAIPCGPGLTVAMHDIDGVLAIAPHGRVGPESRLGLYSVMNSAFTSRPTRIVIDGSHISACDLRGLATFIDAAERAADTGIPFAIGGLAAAQLQLMCRSWQPQITKDLAHPTLDAAVSAVNEHPAASDPSRRELVEDVHHLSDSLAATAVIEQAKGVLMATYGLTSDAAFDLLRRHSQTFDIDVSALASRLIDFVQHSPIGTAPGVEMNALMERLTVGRLQNAVT